MFQTHLFILFILKATLKSNEDINKIKRFLEKTEGKTRLMCFCKGKDRENILNTGETTPLNSHDDNLCSSYFKKIIYNGFKPLDASETMSHSYLQMKGELKILEQDSFTIVILPFSTLENKGNVDRSVILLIPNREYNLRELMDKFIELGNGDIGKITGEAQEVYTDLYIPSIKNIILEKEIDGGEINEPEPQDRITTEIEDENKEEGNNQSQEEINDLYDESSDDFTSSDEDEVPKYIDVGPLQADEPEIIKQTILVKIKTWVLSLFGRNKQPLIIKAKWPFIALVTKYKNKIAFIFANHGN